MKGLEGLLGLGAGDAKTLMGLGALSDSFNKLGGKESAGMMSRLGILGGAMGKDGLDSLGLIGLMNNGKLPIKQPLGVEAIKKFSPALQVSEKDAKENIKPMGGALNKIGHITGSNYNYKGSDERVGGVIAQDVEKVMPEAVPRTEDGTRMVDYAQVTGLLVEAVKELDDKVKKLGG